MGTDDPGSRLSVVAFAELAVRSRASPWSDKFDPGRDADDQSSSAGWEIFPELSTLPLSPAAPGSTISRTDWVRFENSVWILFANDEIPSSFFTPPVLTSPFRSASPADR
jgi:hypothetical protein